MRPFPGRRRRTATGRGRAAGRDPSGSALPLESLAAVGPSLARKLRPLGLLTVGDLLFRRPRRYEAAADEIAISELWGDEEVAIAGVVESVRLRRLPRRRSIVTARIADATGPISANWFNQPWLADRLKPGTAASPPRAALEARLRGEDLRPRRGARDRRPRAGLPRERAGARPRGCGSSSAPRSTRTSTTSLDPLPAELELPIRRDALAALHFPADLAQAERARQRLALDELLALQLAVLRSRVEGAVGRPLPEPGELVARYREVLPFALTERPGAGDRRDRPRSRARAADAAAAAGRRRLGQDGRRALRPSARGRGGPAGRA